MRSFSRKYARGWTGKQLPLQSYLQSHWPMLESEAPLILQP